MLPIDALGGQVPVALGMIAVFTGVNCLNVRSGGNFQTVLTILKVVMILGMAVGALLTPTGDWSRVADAGDFPGWSAFGALVLAALWAYDGWNNLPMAAVLATLMFSLAGIPPLAGFWGKFYAFMPAIKSGYYVLAVIGVLASVVGAYYYLRIVKVMFFDAPAEKFLPIRVKVGIVMALSAIFVLLFVVVPSPLVRAAETAAASFRF